MYTRNCNILCLLHLKNNNNFQKTGKVVERWKLATWQSMFLALPFGNHGHRMTILATCSTVPILPLNLQMGHRSRVTQHEQQILIKGGKNELPVAVYEQEIPLAHSCVSSAQDLGHGVAVLLVVAGAPLATAERRMVCFLRSGRTCEVGMEPFSICCHCQNASTVSSTLCSRLTTCEHSLSTTLPNTSPPQKKTPETYQSSYLFFLFVHGHKQLILPPLISICCSC